MSNRTLETRCGIQAAACPDHLGTKFVDRYEYRKSRQGLMRLHPPFRVAAAAAAAGSSGGCYTVADVDPRGVRSQQATVPKSLIHE